MQNIDILIVEDDNSLMEVTQDFFEDNGYIVEACSTGSSALEQIKKNKYKIIILDINLPDLLGFDVCSIIRKTTKVPIIFLSARISETDKMKLLEEQKIAIAGDFLVSLGSAIEVIGGLEVLEEESVKTGRLVP